MKNRNYEIGLLIIKTITFFIACNNKPNEKTNKELFEETLNDPHIP
jgi:hypothetical protein